MAGVFPKPHFTTNTQYVGVPTYADEPSPALSADYYKQDQVLHQAHLNLQSHPQMKGHRSWIKTLIIQSFCLLWIGPIGLLLYLNIKGHILGASAWCPRGKCYPQVFNPVTSVPQLLLAKFDHRNHNLLGALQLVAKALEVWFILIASWLVYLITMFLAGRKYGLPIAYITRPNEFSELAGLLDPLLWRTLPKPFRGAGKRKARRRVWIFVAFTVFLGIICNLMGPATAVLVLPTLQWVDTDDFKVGTFLAQNSAAPPTADTGRLMWETTMNCTEDDFSKSLWSCTANPFAKQMDGWVESFVAAQDAWNGITQQNLVSFAFNSTAWALDDGTVTDMLSWAPSRQTMQQLSMDLARTQLISQGWGFDEFVKNNIMTASEKDEFDSYVPYNNTVQTFIQRNGPIIGVAANMWLSYDNSTWWDSFLDSSATSGIRCYNQYDLSNTPLARNVLTGTYTKCVKWGDAWNMDYKYSTFTIDGVYKSQIEAFGPSVKFDIWTSDKAAFFENGVLPAGLSEKCLPVNGVIDSSLNCDWDAFFKVDSSSILSTRSELVNTIQLSTQYTAVEGHPQSMDLMFDFVAYLNFTTYALDPSPISNPLTLATMPDLPMSGAPVPVDPSWTLAAWSVDDGGNMVANRSSAIAVLHAFDRFWELDVYNHPNPLGYLSPDVDFIALLPIIQTLSVIDSDIDLTSNTPADPKTKPQLIRNARLNVWAYGMSSRTAWLGVAVAVLGVIIVAFQVFLGIIDRRPYRSPTELLVAALEHTPHSPEFMGKDHDELAIARTPFRVEDMHLGHASKFKFEKSL